LRIGDAEAEIRKAFSLARQSSPCILFLDEVDALVTDRSSDTSSTGAESRVLAMILTEIDGLSTNSGDNGILIMGATNRVDCIDKALLRKVYCSYSNSFRYFNCVF
jgi:SpoVK/Ycf46/Vps4 family AAA+-type ATPase